MKHKVIDMARYMTEWLKMCLTYLTYLMCLRIQDSHQQCLVPRT